METFNLYCESRRQSLNQPRTPAVVAELLLVFHSFYHPQSRESLQAPGLWPELPFSILLLVVAPISLSLLSLAFLAVLGAEYLSLQSATSIAVPSHAFARHHRTLE
jgi:hypothetical protein